MQREQDYQEAEFPLTPTLSSGMGRGS